MRFSLLFQSRLGKAAFFELRYEDDGVTERKDFVLNQAGQKKRSRYVTMGQAGRSSIGEL